MNQLDLNMTIYGMVQNGYIYKYTTQQISSVAPVTLTIKTESNKTLSRAQYPARRWRPATFHCAYLRMITFYLLPMLGECGRGSISLQSPVTYQVETDQCTRNFESVMPDLPLFLLTSSR